MAQVPVHFRGPTFDDGANEVEMAMRQGQRLNSTPLNNNPIHGQIVAPPPPPQTQYHPGDFGARQTKGQHGGAYGPNGE